jgi:hypothetical protein
MTTTRSSTDIAADIRDAREIYRDSKADANIAAMIAAKRLHDSLMRDYRAAIMREASNRNRTP